VLIGSYRRIASSQAFLSVLGFVLLLMLLRAQLQIILVGIEEMNP
jgi:hypothetical protein